MLATRAVNVQAQLHVVDGCGLMDIVQQLQLQSPEYIWAVVDDVNIRTFIIGDLTVKYERCVTNWYIFSDEHHFYKIYGYRHAARFWPELPVIEESDGKGVTKVYKFTLVVGDQSIVAYQPMRELVANSWYVKS